MGYSQGQIRDLEETISRAEIDLVLFATPIHLTRILSITKPTIRVRYEYQDRGEPTLKDALLGHLDSLMSE
jgi:predicted GTPase